MTDPKPTRAEMLRVLSHIKDTIQTRPNDLEGSLDIIAALVESGFVGFMNPANREALARTYALGRVFAAVKEAQNEPTDPATPTPEDQRLAE